MAQVIVHQLLITSPSHLLALPRLYQSQPQGVHQPQPAGVHQPQPAGVHQPQPAGVHQPQPTGVHQPQPAGVHQSMSLDNRNPSVISDDGRLIKLLPECS